MGIKNDCKEIELFICLKCDCERAGKPTYDYWSIKIDTFRRLVPVRTD